MEAQNNELLLKLKAKANRLPLKAGIYIMKDKNGNIIYIGKAKALKNRVTQYFGLGNQHSLKVQKMVSNIADFEYILCDSEFEALILENSLIKQNQPKYNILLKDDKGYFYIKITNERWKKIKSCKLKDKNGEFIGPYNSGYIVNKTVDEALKIFKLPSCNRNFDTKSKPCLNYHIGLCDAPCNGKIPLKDYLETVEAAREFIKNGENEDTSVEELTKKMNTASENLEFETAAKLRDRINALKRIKQKQKVVSISYKQQDVIATASFGTLSCVEILIFRNFKLTDKKHYFIEDMASKEEIYSEFLQQYYLNKSDIPNRILIDISAENFDTTARWLSEKSGRRVEFINPKQGQQKEILQMCLNNAAQVLSEKTERNSREMNALNELGELLGLKQAPRYIESYDISNISGSQNVAGMVVFKDGRPLKSDYKRFKIKSFAGQDDYRSMAEVLYRRFSEYKEGTAGFTVLPDLILLDGAAGQISSVLPVLSQLDLQIPVFGMVKDSKHRTRAIATTGGDIAIKSNKYCFNLVTAIQDEVHRYAISYHKKLRSKQMLSRELTQIEGIGQAKANTLLKNFGSIKKIKSATKQELMQIKGITAKNAENIYSFFND